MGDQFDEDAERMRIQPEFFRKLYEQIDKLPVKCREALTLMYLQGMKENEIAATFNISTSTVRNQMAYAIKN